MKTSFAFLLPLLLVLLSISLSAQKVDFKLPSEGKIQIIRTVDNNEYIGKIIAIEEDHIILVSNTTEIKIFKKNIVSIKEIDEKTDKSGKFWFPNTHASRYLFSPSAIPLERGEGYYQNVYITVNSVHYGISDNISIGGGFELISTILGVPIWYIAPKAGFQVAPDVHLGAGVLMGGILAVREEVEVPGVLFIPFGLGTYGNREKNITIGFGWPLTTEGSPDQPVLNLAGMYRVSRSVSLISENYILPGIQSGYMVSYGIRFMREKISIDFALFNNHEMASTLWIPIGIPFIDLVFKF